MKLRRFKTPAHIRAQRFAQRHRDFPRNTCPASRHVQMIGEALIRRKKYPMIDDEPEDVGGALLSTVGSLYKARTRVKRLERTIAKLRGRK